ncbi:hypothetical protein BGZ96_007123 [Linnemannia gamsii]|uniref:glucan endo-1,3-beta-D-glucosidase n=1 Tax=Linnemannia gamsii TaxID=64522 RepID=A0ABQ7K1I5_9FUNG|nr:hypothetical protein BGZ96_007123 [Linnemannia gamsii]
MSHNHDNNNKLKYLDDEVETADYGYDRNASNAIHSTPQDRYHKGTNPKVAIASGGVAPVKTKRSSSMSRVLWLVAVLVVLVVAGILVWYYAFYKKNHGNEGNNGIGGGSEGGTNGDLGDGTAGQGTTNCNALRYTIDTIQRLKLNLQVVVGIWIEKDSATYTRQTEELYAVVAKYGWSNIIGVSVKFDQVESLSTLMTQITAVKNKVVQLGHPEIPVFTSDLESANRPPLTNQEDLAGVNLHPFFSGVPVDAAASWFWTYLNNTVSPAVQQGNLKPIPLWITEVGWPTFPATGNTNASIPSIPNLQKFVDTWLCEANAKNPPYYFFEFFDAPWKIRPGSAVEGFWDLLTIDKRLKVELPDCLAH